MPAEHFIPDALHWVHYVRLRVEAGWEPVLLTFMFDQMPGGDAAIRRQQAREVEAIYARVVTRMVRRPASCGAVGRLPIWLCFPDLPVRKSSGNALRDILLNGGAHVHAFHLSPPVHRMRTDFAAFVNENQSLLTNGLRCDRVHAKAIARTEPYVLGYAAKSILSHRIEEESYFLLPRSQSEVCAVPRRSGDHR